MTLQLFLREKVVTSLETKQFSSIRKPYLRFKLSSKKNAKITTLLKVILSLMIKQRSNNSLMLTSIPTLKVRKSTRSFVSSSTNMLVTKITLSKSPKTKNETCSSSCSISDDPWQWSSLLWPFERTWASLEFSIHLGNIRKWWSKSKVLRRSFNRSLISHI